MYIRKRRSTEKNIKTQVSKREKHKREGGRERRVDSVTICINLASSGELVEGEIPFYFLRLTLSSLS